MGERAVATPRFASRYGHRVPAYVVVLTSLCRLKGQSKVHVTIRPHPAGRSLGFRSNTHRLPCQSVLLCVRDLYGALSPSASSGRTEAGPVRQGSLARADALPRIWQPSASTIYFGCEEDYELRRRVFPDGRVLRILLSGRMEMLYPVSKRFRRKCPLVRTFCHCHCLASSPARDVVVSFSARVPNGDPEGGGATNPAPDRRAPVHQFNYSSEFLFCCRSSRRGGRTRVAAMFSFRHSRRLLSPYTDRPLCGCVVRHRSALDFHEHPAHPDRNGHPLPFRPSCVHANRTAQLPQGIRPMGSSSRSCLPRICLLDILRALPSSSQH